MKSEEGLGIEYDENVICDVCRSPDSEDGNEMVFCDMCNICVHQACYGITVIPEGKRSSIHRYTFLLLAFNDIAIVFFLLFLLMNYFKFQGNGYVDHAGTVSGPAACCVPTMAVP